MGLIRGYFTLINPTRPDLAPLEVSALADSGAVHLCIPEHLAIQLSLAELERREVVLADGRRRTVPYVGPVEVRFRNRRCFTGAMVLGNEVLLGAIPMADMDLVLRPQLQCVDVNPESPNIPLSVAATPFEEMQVENKRDPQTAEVVLTPLPPSLTALSVRGYALHNDPDFQAEITMFGAGLRDSRPADPVQWTW
jgi:clan AA aspartic protease